MHGACDTRGDMLLSSYLAQNGKTDKTFAREIGISRSQVSRLRHRKVNPSFKTAVAIGAATGGKVTMADMLRPQIREAAE